MLCAPFCRFHIRQGMQAGMIVSNEPGYYEDGAFGIRIENLLIARQADTAFQFGGLPYVSFERLTLVPLQRKLMDLKVCPQSILVSSPSSPCNLVSGTSTDI